MHRKFFHIICLYLLAAFQVEAANIVIEVRDDQRKENLPAAKIEYKHSNKTALYATTNAYGKVELKEVNFPIQITCSYIGFETLNKVFTEKEVPIKNGKYYIHLYLQTKYNKLHDMVVTAQSTPVLSTQSVYKVNTISAAQIAERGAATLNEVLNFENNNFVSNDNILGSAVNIGGVGGQNVKILINGIPIAGRENGSVDLGQMNLQNIKKVEMIQGPMSVMYGSNALGGVINLITHTPLKPYSISAKTYLESIGRYNFTGNFAYNKHKHQANISISRNFFQGWTPETDSTKLDRFMLWKPKTQYIADLQYTYRTKQSSISYFTSYLQEKITNKGTPIINPYEGYAFDEYYRTYRNIHSIGINHQLSKKENITFINSYTLYERIKNRFKKNLVSLEEYLTKSVGDQDTSIFHNVNSRATISSQRLKSIQMLAGYEYTFETAKSFKLSEDKKDMSELGLFASGLYQYKQLSIQPSVRYTLHNQFGHAWTPAFHAKYNIDSFTQWRFSFASGFRAPSLKELYLQFIDQNHTIIGNPDLKPETGTHWETGITHTRQVGKNNIQLSATAYYNAIQNYITLAVYNGHGVLRKYANIDQYRNYIGMVQCKWSVGQIQMQHTGSFTHVFESSIVPTHQILEYSGLISYKSKILQSTINFNYKYNSKQPVLTIEDKYLFTSPLHIANASVQRSFFKNYLSAQIGIKNLFNIQNTRLQGNTEASATAHSSSSGMQLFPARSIFIVMNYSL